MSSHRLQQINELIKQELGKLFLKEINFPKGCLVTITKITTSADFSQAKVSISVLPANQQSEIIAGLNKRAGYLKFLLGKNLSIYKTPKLIFQPDLALKKIAHIDELIDKIHKEE